MLPPSHIAYTIALLSEAQQRTGRFAEADYRLVILAALGPDLVDKPLAWLYFYKRYRSAVLFAHTALAHLAVLGLVAWRAPHWLVYALAWNGHALLDRLWFFHDTWYWPLRGWRFHEWRRQGSEQATLGLAYWHTFTRRPALWRWEVGGMLALLWFVARNRLWQRARLAHLLRTGRVP